MGDFAVRIFFMNLLLTFLVVHRGLSWHTTDETLREKFSEFGQVDEAVSDALELLAITDMLLILLIFRSSSRTVRPVDRAGSVSFATRMRGMRTLLFVHPSVLTKSCRCCALGGGFSKSGEC